MMRFRTGVLLTLMLFMVGLGIYALMTVRDLGEFREITPKEPPNCQPVLGVNSSEDITIDPETGIAYISGADRQGFRGEFLPGEIYSYPLLSTPVQPTVLATEIEFEFRPHGLSLYRCPDGTRLLFVVNHRSEGDYVEIFELQDTDLVHRESITGDLLFSANDIVAVGERQFYATRDHRYRAGWARQLEEYLRLGTSSVIYFDGSEFAIVAEDIAYANGINLGRDAKRLYVAATLTGSVHVFDRDPTTGNLDPKEEIALGTGADNIEMGPDGDLWIAAHPKLLTFVDYSLDPSLLSPSQVIRLTFLDDGEHRVDTVYMSEGEYLSGSSVAARWGNYLLIGSVFDQRFLLCRMETTPTK